MKPCPTNKYGYPSHDRAKRALKETLRRKRKGKLMVYQCNFCHQWHIGGTLNPSQKIHRKNRKRYEEEEG